MPFSLLNFKALAPEIFLVLVASFMVLFDRAIRAKDFFFWTALLGTLVAWWLCRTSLGISFGESYTADHYGFFLKTIFLLSLFLSILISPVYARRRGFHFGEYYGLLYFAVCGMMLMASGTDLLLIYIGLELMSLSIYVLVAVDWKDPRGLEGGLKYFLLGSLASAFLILGLAIIYGRTGTLFLAKIHQHLSVDPAVLAGIAFFLVALGFKVAMVPFHMWAPDAYEGAPTPVTAFMSVAAKAAGFAALGRIFLLAFASAHPMWIKLLVPFAVLTMFVGNILAVVQTNIKRMLAYSSVAHAGYILLGIAAGTREGLSAVLLYLLIYAFMNIGAFGIVTLLQREGGVGESIYDYQGLARLYPFPALLMLLFMFSLTGIPPTAGFMGKFYLFRSVVHAGHPWLAVLAVLASVIAAYPYLRIVMFMYMREPERELRPAFSLSLWAALGISALGVLVIGLYPGSLLHAVMGSVF
ncbi:NADH-quinone oxidoreductase subunit N [Thermosulfurimonas sp.]|uniref:NADH-quinone oxidoreductase subunit N n=1 Tax=Thermosulfurimonas sp. TaxID=2080236 RepID=UPI0025D12404|nr:NADH-quinone oxidoreductase subunit N [Thermosulfurimonas sp.]